MHPVANHLIQLQELGLIRDEQQVTVGRGHLEQLDLSVAEMVAKLPPEVRTLYRKLKDKDAIVIAPVSETNCAACGMRLPISLVQAVRMEKEIHSCPNCARMLYWSETHVRGIGQRVSRVGPQKVGIARFSSQTLMIPDLESDTVEGAIRELAFRLRDEGFVDKADQLVEAALRREAIVSTAIGNSMAFPHVRGIEGGGLALALGISRKGVHFEGPEGKSVRIIFFLAIPTAASAFYLKLLSGLATTFADAEARKALLGEKDPEKVWKVLVKATRAAIK